MDFLRENHWDCLKELYWVTNLGSEKEKYSVYHWACLKVIYWGSWTEIGKEHHLETMMDLN